MKWDLISEPQEHTINKPFKPLSKQRRTFLSKPKKVQSCSNADKLSEFPCDNAITYKVAD